MELLNPTLFKHECNTDVAFSIDRSFFVKEKKLFKLHVTWWNIGACHEPWCMRITQKLEITLEDWKRWHIYTWTKNTTWSSESTPDGER